MISGTGRCFLGEDSSAGGATWGIRGVWRRELGYSGSLGASKGDESGGEKFERGEYKKWREQLCLL